VPLVPFVCARGVTEWVGVLVAASSAAAMRRASRDASSAVMWGGPTWFVTGDPVCYVRATGGELLFGFWNGGSLHDPSGRMRAHGSIMGHAVVASVEDVDEELFAAWLDEARGMARRLA